MDILNSRTSGRSLHDPFRTFSNHVYPKTIHDVFVWARYYWERNAQYRTAIEKVVSYFVAGINVTQDKQAKDVDADAVEEFKERLIDDYGMLEQVTEVGIELAAMGNVFVSCEYMFSRSLQCPRKGCGWQKALHMLHKDVDYTWDGKDFKGVCEHCKKPVTFRVEDTPTTDNNGCRVRFCLRDVDDMQIQYNQLTRSYKYYYKLPSHIKNAIIRGDQVYLENTPKVFLKAASTDNLIEFPEDLFFSMRTTTLSCLDKLYKGWGLPLFMSSFDNMICLQFLHKFNEAVTLDYIAPIRMLSPQAQNLQAGITDPNRMPMSGGTFRSFMQRAIGATKDNPATYLISPVPVQYQMLGGEAKQLAPVDLMEWYKSQNLSDMGIPQEFRQTNFQVVAPTMGMRMFERQWIHFAKALNRFLIWAGNCIADAHKLENMTASLDVTSFVENDMNTQVKLNLMQSGVISRTDVLKSFGVDFEDDAKRRIQEQKKEDELATEMQQEAEGKEMVSSVMPPAASLGIGQAQSNIEMMQQQAQGGSMPEQPGMPAMPSGAMPGGGMGVMPFNTGASESASIEQMYNEAQQMAQQLYSAPPNIRRAQLVQLKNSNPALHAQVSQMLSDMRQKVGSDAIAQSQQPQG